MSASESKYLRLMLAALSPVTLSEARVFMGGDVTLATTPQEIVDACVALKFAMADQLVYHMNDTPPRGKYARPEPDPNA